MVLHNLHGQARGPWASQIAMFLSMVNGHTDGIRFSAKFRIELDSF